MVGTGAIHVSSMPVYLRQLAATPDPEAELIAQLEYLAPSLLRRVWWMLARPPVCLAAAAGRALVIR